MSEPETPTRLDPVSRFFGLKAGDLAIVAPAIVCAFSLFSAYSVAKPLRDAIGASVGSQQVAALQTGTFVAMIFASALVGLLVSRLSWKTFVLFASAVWVLGAATTAVFFALAGTETSHVVDKAFFIALSVFNLLSLSIFWATMSDILDADRAKRAFPAIGLGITIGAIAGSWFVSTFARSISYSGFIWISCGLLMIAGLALTWILRFAPARARQKRRTPGGSIAEMAEGMWTALASPYLRRLTLYLLLYSATGTLVYMLQLKIIGASVLDLSPEKAKVARAEISASIDFYANVLTALLQLFVAGRVLRWIGVSAALTITPLSTLASIFLLLWSPTVAMLIPVQVARRGFHYALDRPAREVLYTVVSPVERYKSKNFIDTFVYRFGDVVGGWSQVGLDKVLPSVGVAGVAVLCLIFAGTGVSLGRIMRRREVSAKQMQHDAT
ncbi:MAG: hypothetical protein KF805_16730 [Phycisphaeraceae bacterium]|nr:hypothetical protein [Phycisphaeraceae bacterium]